MRNIVLVLTFILSCLCSTVKAESDTVKVEADKFYLGLNISTISFHIYYKADKTPGAVRAGYFVPISVNLGYKINERMSVQVGLAYGGDRHEVTILQQAGSHEYKSRTNAIASPAAFRFIFFNLNKKFPIYGTTSIMPAYGVTKTSVVQTSNSGTTKYTVTDSGFDVFATAGAGFNYRINNRFSGNVEYLFFKTNITGENSKFYDWDQDYPGLRSYVKSFGFGINYNLR